MKILVTGANGLLGTNTIIHLLANGYSVRALVRKGSKHGLQSTGQLEIKEGDINDTLCLDRAVKGCDHVVHTAAETRQDLRHYKDYAKINVSATDKLFAAANKHQVKRIVHVSTSNVYGFGSVMQPGDERSDMMLPYSDSLYAKSKLEGQKVALSYSDKTEVIVINPTFMIGPNDQKPGSSRIVLMGYNKRILFYPPGGKNFVHVADVVSAIGKALVNGKNGETYLIANENLSYSQFFEKMSYYSNTNPVLIKIPKFVLLTIGVFGNLLKWIGIRTEMSLTNMRILCVNNFYSNTKAEEQLGIKFKPIDLALEEAIAWFKSNKYL